MMLFIEMSRCFVLESGPVIEVPRKEALGFFPSKHFMIFRKPKTKDLETAKDAK